MDIESSIQDVFKQAFDLFKNQYVALIIATIIAAIGSIFILTAPPLFFGLYYMAAKVMRGEKAEIMDVFKGFDYFVTSWIMMIAAVIALIVGFICFIIPGLFLIVVFQYAVAIAIIEKKSAMASLQRSYELGKDNLAFSIVFLVITSIINGLGSAVAVLWLVTFPYTVIATCLAAKKLSEGTKKTA